MKRLHLVLSTCVLAATISACQSGSVTEPDARMPHGPSYNGGMAGSGGYVTTDGGGTAGSGYATADGGGTAGSGHMTTTGIGTAGSGGVTTATSDTTDTARGIGMAGSGH